MNKIVSYLKKHQAWTIPALLTLALYIPLLVWLKLDNSLPHWDMGRHLYTSVEYGRLWSDFVAGRIDFMRLLTSYFYYPPFFYQAGVIFYLFAGLTQKVAVASNLVWIFVLIYSTYHLARLTWNKKTAILSVAAIFSMPIIIGASHEYQIDLPLTAWVALAALLFVQYKNKPETRKAVWIGVVLGLGMLLKWTFILYVLPFAFWALIAAVYSQKLEIKKSLLHLLWAFIFALLICGWWYIANRASIKADFLANGIEAARREGDPTGLTVAAFGFYFKELLNVYLLVPLGIIAFAGCILSFVQRQRFHKNFMLIVSIVFIYIVCSSVPNKDPRYIMPMVPFIAILAASSINFIRTKGWQMVFALGLILILGVNNITTAFGASRGHDLSLGSNLILVRGSSYTSGAPKSQFCPVEAIIHSIPQGASARLVGNNPIEFNNWALAFYLEKEGRVWAGEGEDASESDYWIVRLDGSTESKEVLFRYQDMARIVANYSCSDKSLIIVMKNANRAETYLPRY